MEIALDYIRTLIWPAVIVLVLLFFGGNLRALLSRIATQSEEISATAFGFGVSAKLRQVVELVEKSEPTQSGDLRKSLRIATQDLVIEEFRRLSGYFFSSAHPVRAQAAAEVAGLAPFLPLEALLDFAASTHPGERVAATIGLGVYAGDSIQVRQDVRVIAALRRLLTDHFSRVRYRAVEAMNGCPELGEALRPELYRLVDTDPNESVKNLAQRVLAQNGRHVPPSAGSGHAIALSSEPSASSTAPESP
jgi:hypothetical protein